MAVTQSHYRFGIDQGTESTHGWYAPEDTSPAAGTIRPGLTFLLRFCLQCDGTLQSNIDPEFQYRKNGGTWTNITTSSTVVKAVTPTCWADAANTTQRLSGTGTFESSSNGCTVDGVAGGANFDIVANGNGETECALQLVPADVTFGDLIEFRLTRDGGVLIDTYAVTPSVQIAEPVSRPRIARGPFPFPKSTPDFLPTPSAGAQTGLTGVESPTAIGSMALAMAAGLAGIAAAGAITLGGTSVTVGLTGVSSASAQGSLGFAQALTGVSSAGAVGTAGATVSVSLSGVSSAGSVGTLTPTSGVVVDLSGVSSAGALGTLGLTSSPALTGASTASAQGSVSASFDDSLNIQRPRIARGPFPFPKAGRSFKLDSPTIVALTGVESSVDDGDLTHGGVTIGLTGTSSVGQRGTIQAGTPGSTVLVGLSADPGTGTLTPVTVIALSGVTAGAAIGDPIPSKSYIERPHYLAGPLPFLEGGFLFQFRGRPRPVNVITGQSITVQLTGVSAAWSVGSMTSSRTVAQSGQAMAGSAGTLTPVFSVAESGVSAGSATGTLGFGQALAGVSATGSVGTVTPVFAVPLTGVSATTALGTIAAQNDGSVTLLLSGVSTLCDDGTLSPVSSVATSGVAASSLAVGSVTTSRTITPTGQVVASELGTPSFALDGTASLSGVSSAASSGSVGAVIAPILSGFDIDAVAGEVGGQQVQALNQNRTIALTGVSVSGQVGLLSGPGSAAADVVVVIRPWVTTIQVRP